LLFLWLSTARRWHIGFEACLLFLIGFSLAMHIVMSAQTLREEDTSPVKPNYFFTMSWVYIANLILVVVLLSLISAKISPADFLKDGLMRAKQMYWLLFKHLF
jgi:hypothetical protein